VSRTAPSGREDDLRAAAADVGHDHVLAGEVEGVLHAREGIAGLPLPRDHLHLEADLLPHATAEVGAIAGLADGTCRDRPQLRRLEALGDLAEGLEGLDRLLHRLLVERPLGVDAAAEPRRLPLLVEDPVGAPAEGLGHQEPHAVAADVDGRNPAAHLRRQEDLLFVHGRCVLESDAHHTVSGHFAGRSSGFG
jgi:hypothetical protein